MKKVILIGDGMGDYPVPQLGDRTPLQAADIPAMRRLAACGQLHQILTVADHLPPGSDVCNMGLMGYNAADAYTGRAPIEAAGAGIPLRANDVAYRCNLVTVQDDVMVDYSAGHITTEEGDALIRSIAAELNDDQKTFHPGVSYRHLLVWHHGPAAIETCPPHDISDQSITPHLPAGEGAAAVREIMERSKAIFANHPVNQARVAAGKAPATQLWLWGQGTALTLPTYPQRYGLTGGVITAVDLVRGLGILAGLEVPRVPGATGFVDTNYEGKVAAAQQLLADHDFVYVHLEAPDECGHLGDAELKTKAITDFDHRVVGPMWDYLEAQGEPYRLIVTMDHRTPIATRSHTREPVPLVWLDGPVGPVDQQAPFDEDAVSDLPVERSYTLIDGALRAAD
jgi:2,3-bisphosphoglycerate-independent phosphoglycerate mutase